MQQTPERLTPGRVEDGWDIDADDEIGDLPREKLIELFRSANVIVGTCESCNERTWLTGAMGRNSTSECHNCGAEYHV